VKKTKINSLTIEHKKNLEGGGGGGGGVGGGHLLSMTSFKIIYK